MKPLITLAMAVYGQPKMLDVWFDTLRTYHPGVLERMELLIVDDCGIPQAAIPDDITQLLKCRLFRVSEDIPWNQGGARNLALDQCKTPLIMFVDPDMVFTADMMIRMLSAGESLPKGEVIRFMLKHKGNNKLDGSSPNTWFLHVSDLLKVGGYDEDFVGHKGWSDVQLLDVLGHFYKVHHRKDLYAYFYNTDQVDDAMVTSLDRSHVFNRKLRLRKMNWVRSHGGWKAFVKAVNRKSRVRFTWQRTL